MIDGGKLASDLVRNHADFSDMAYWGSRYTAGCNNQYVCKPVA